MRRSMALRSPGLIRRVLALGGLALGGLALLAAAPPRAHAQGPGGTPLGADIERAISAGSGWLARSLARDGLGPISSGYPLGARALYAYALLESGSGTDDPLVRGLFQQMAAEEHRQVYDVSLYVLALHSWKEHGVPLVTEGAAGTEIASETLPGGLEVRDEIARSVDWLLRARLRGAGTWGYGSVAQTRDSWTDFSNTQFAALALHVGVLEGLDVPAAVFEEIVGAFSVNSLAGPDEISVSVDRAPWLGEGGRTGERKESAGRTAVGGGSPGEGARRGVTLEGRPISWGYRPLEPAQRRSGRAGWGTLSMTSAAVSSLLVAEAGLAARGGGRRNVETTLDALVTGGVIELSRAFRPLTERTAGSMHRNIWYTLYSFEKAMDLAGIRVLDGLDWYRAQVPELLVAQRPDGAWGIPYAGDAGEYQRMATSFALLFLRRATSSLTVHEPARIITHGEGGPTGIATGRVFVPSLGGAVELDDLFRRLEAEPNRELLGIAREAVDSVVPDERPELLRWLIPLREKGARDRAGAFAREVAAEITGLPAGCERAALETWSARWRRLGEISARGEMSAAGEVEAWIGEESLGAPLRLEAMVVLRRLGALDAVPALLALLEDRDPAIRDGAYRTVVALTLADLPWTAGAEAKTRAEQAAALRAWWDASGEELRVTRRFEALRQRLERAEDPEERASVRAELVSLGPAIVPRIERILAARSYAFDWLLVRQELTGEAGVR